MWAKGAMLAMAAALGAQSASASNPLPDDAANIEASLLHVAVLRRTDWVTQFAQLAPPPGVEVATGATLVAMATVPPANPYSAGTRDADIFDALLPAPADISRIVRFPSRSKK